MKRLIYIALCLALVTPGLSSMALASDNYRNLLGVAIDPSTAGKSVVIQNDTHHVSLIEGESVRFVVGAKSFAWEFDGPYTIGSIDLKDIAPPGFLDHPVQIYISRNPVTDGR